MWTSERKRKALLLVRRELRERLGKDDEEEALTCLALGMVTKECKALRRQTEAECKSIAHEQLWLAAE